MNNSEVTDIYKRSFSQVAVLPGYLLFFLMIFVPTAYRIPKAALMAIVLLFISISVFLHSGRLRLHKTVFLWTFFYLAIGSLWIANGYIHDAPGAIRVASVYIFWPFIYLVYVSGISSERFLRMIIRILVFATIAIAVYDFSYILYFIGLIPDYLFFEIDQGARIGIYSGFIEYRMYHMSSLLFLVPFLLAAIITWTENPVATISRRWLWIAFILGMMTVLLSGRRILMLVVALSPIITLALMYFLPDHFFRIRNIKKFIYIVIGIISFFLVLLFYLKSLFDFKMGALIRMFLKGFDFLGGGSAGIRYEQFIALLDGWEEYPLFGAGHGAAVGSYIRSSKMPWAYELSYMAMLFQTGLVGFFLYSSGVIWIFWMGIRMIRSGYSVGRKMLPILTGTCCFLIGNATNPYLTKYDYIWVIFLPIAFINYWMLHKFNRKKEIAPLIS